MRLNQGTRYFSTDNGMSWHSWNSSKQESLCENNEVRKLAALRLSKLGELSRANRLLTKVCSQYRHKLGAALHIAE